MLFCLAFMYVVDLPLVNHHARGVEFHCRDCLPEGQLGAGVVLRQGNGVLILTMAKQERVLQSII